MLNTHPLASLVTAGLLAALASPAHATPIKLSFTGNFTQCSGSPCSQAIDINQWNNVSGSFIYDPAARSGTTAPPNGAAPAYFSNNLVHTFSGLSGFQASLDVGGVHAESTGSAPPPNPAPGYQGFTDTSGSIAVYDGQAYRSGDWVEFRDQSMSNITGAKLPPGGFIATSPYNGPAAVLMLSFAFRSTDDPLKNTAIPLDMDSLYAPSGLSSFLTFGFWWGANAYHREWLVYSGQITSFSSSPYIATGSSSGGGSSGGKVPEPGTLSLLALALGGLALRRRH